METVMKTSVAILSCGFALALVGCSADDAGTGEAEDEVRAKTTLRCEAGAEKLALLPAVGGKSSLVALAPAGNVYALTGRTGTLKATTKGWSWKSNVASLTIGANLKGTFERDGQSTAVTCEAAAAETMAWRAAAAVASYAVEIDDLADVILETADADDRPEADDPPARPKRYTAFAIETSRRSSLSLGQKAPDSGGALPGEDAEYLLDENDFSYGGASAASALGGGDDYAEWFQGASDGISLSAKVAPEIVGGPKAGFIARVNATSFASVVDSAKPSVVEITVGAWTFYLPDAFPK